jgi:ribosome modulation factor
VLRWERDVASDTMKHTHGHGVAGPTRTRASTGRFDRETHTVDTHCTSYACSAGQNSTARRSTYTSYVSSSYYYTILLLGGPGACFVQPCTDAPLRSTQRDKKPYVRPPYVVVAGRSDLICVPNHAESRSIWLGSCLDCS